MGACQACGTPITSGQLQWQVAFTDLLSRSAARSRRRPSSPAARSRQCAGRRSKRAISVSRGPSCPVAIRSSTRSCSTRGSTWSTTRSRPRSAPGGGDDGRPYVTDRMYQTLRFGIERYTAQGLRNQLDDVKLERTRIAKIELDAWYESITVRLWGSCKDSVVDRSGRVIGGNAQVARRFSEYWTFLRSAEGPADSHGDRLGCRAAGRRSIGSGRTGSAGTANRRSRPDGSTGC